ncbi:DUF4139 domain-containing protein [Polyangium aurulentum]|uniref:DUF4139 domain-containing protein n=1 Tax=Polyangium aurulentum TaxID=2567896 RepID=UPI0010ADDB12|nr:DUF4139 domain-containing protein [Polyangium aurulentum]UQA61902.1 DUF4139 domain-containing protein [Polyangium aurulentum]
MLPLACDSRIHRVVVHARGAVVTRRVELPPDLPTDLVEIAVTGITPFAEPASVHALARGGREVVYVHARIVIPEGSAAPGPAIERVRELEHAREALTAERAHLGGRRNLLAGLEFNLGMDRRLRPVDPKARIADALATARLVSDELAALDARMRKLDHAIEKASRDIEAARLAAAQARTEERAGSSRPTFTVLVRLAAGQGAVEALDLEYTTLAARWWPTYKAWLSKGATRVRWDIDALVAQASGEDWKGVELSLSTADLVHDARLPELKSLRLGRAQPPAKKGFRPPPPGLDAMFEPFDAAMAQVPPAPRVEPEMENQALRRSRSAEPRPPGAMPAAAAPSPQSFGMPPPAPNQEVAVMQSLAHALAPKSKMSAPALVSRASAAYGGGAGAGSMLAEVEMALEESAAADVPAAVTSIEPDDKWLDFDSLVLASAREKDRRGRLTRVPDDASRSSAYQASNTIEHLESPARTLDPLATRGRFDHRYDAEGRADVPSNARPHRVHVQGAEGPATARFRSVPRESAQVYREARIENPHRAPLLGGPVDVFLDGALVTTTSIGAVDRGGLLLVGLGVEDRLRVARNARVEESSAGLLGGSSLVDHHVTVDFTSSLGVPVTVEVLERIPVTDDKDISVKVTSADPEPEIYDQSDIGAPVRGGRRFRVEVPAGGKARMSYGYRVKLPAKSEIVGGNRRE